MEKRLVGEQVDLHPTHQDDLAFLLQLWNDGEVMSYVGYPQGLGIDEQGMEAWFTRLGVDRGVDRKHWIVKDEQGERIGEAFYKVEQEYCDYRAENMVHVDIKLAKRFWKQGYAADALRTLTQHLFNNLGIETIVVSPNLANKAALKLYRYLGFKPENQFQVEETQMGHRVWALHKSKPL